MDLEFYLNIAVFSKKCILVCPLHTSSGAVWLCDARGAVCLCDARGAVWLCDARGAVWLCDARGAVWLPQ